jgi:adenine phosphoribosyltransferase
MKKTIEHLKSKIRTVPHWPKQGVMFRDITTLLKDAEGYNKMMGLLVKRYKNMEIDYVAGIESRGFVTGSVLAHKLGVGFITIRKKGKLPGNVTSEEYDLEYGKDKIEIHTDAIKPGDKILICDDLIATGGTSVAACKLIEKLGGKVVECSFIIDLPDLKGKEKLENAGYKVFKLIDFEGD